MNYKKTIITGSISVALLSLSGCASTSSSGKGLSNKSIGCTIGILGGALIGNRIDGRVGAIMGAGIGALIGCSIGDHLDKREAKLAEEAKKANLEAEFSRITFDKEQGGQFKTKTDSNEAIAAHQITVGSKEPLFASGQARISDPLRLSNTREFLKNFINSRSEGSKIFVVGHTDSSGSAVSNQTLSEARARFIATELAQLGVKKSDILFEGVGESQPITSNYDAIGRAKNRRFDLIEIAAKSKEEQPTRSDVVAISQLKKQQMQNAVFNAPSKKEIIKKKAELNREAKNMATVTKRETSKRSRTNVVNEQQGLGLSGVPIDLYQPNLLASLGTPDEDGWSIFSKAYANDDAVVSSCAFSEPRAESSVRSLDSPNGRNKYSAGDFLPLLHGTSWYAKTKKAEFLLRKVTVTKDTYTAVNNPILTYRKSGDKIMHNERAQVETYRGNGAVLYRVYVTSKQSALKCADFVFNTQGSKQTKSSGIVYYQNGDVYGADIKFRHKS